MKDKALAFTGAIIGGTVGYFAFFWIVRQGLYGLILPGGLLGLGASVVPSRSAWFCAVFGVMALALGLFTEWRFAPFIKDGSLLFFLAHVYQLRPITLFMIGAGAVIGFWAPFRRSARVVSSGG